MAETGGIAILDAEENDTNEWTSLVQEGSNTFVASGSAAIHGSYGFQLDYDGVNNDCYGIYDYASPETDVYARFYLNLSILDTGGSGDIEIMRFIDLGVGAAFQMRLYERASNNWGMSCWVNNGGNTIVNLAGSDVLTEGTEYYIEVHYTQHATTGGAQVWVDGASQGSNFTIDTSGYNVDELRVGTQLRSVPTNASVIYIDDVKTDNSYIGAYSDAGADALPMAMISYKRRR